jgi:hypothetical protein
MKKLDKGDGTDNNVMSNYYLCDFLEIIDNKK